MIGALRKDDYVCSTYRDHVHALSKGVPSREIMAELFGKKTGICRGQGGSMHMFSKEHGLVRPWGSLGLCSRVCRILAAKKPGKKLRPLQPPGFCAVAAEPLQDWQAMHSRVHRHE